MRRTKLTIVLMLLSVISFIPVLMAQDRNFTIKELQKPVEILVDHWGIPHIYAETETDLFFAQGFYAAQDRLFQLEIWRRQATGTVAEILGERELQRDIGTRLFQFRGELKRELDHYHPRGGLIIQAFVDGVNAYIERTLEGIESLPPEFQLLGIKPQKWTADIVISRHQGLLGNVAQELDMARAVAKIGAKQVQALAYFEPGNPNLEMDPRIDQSLLFEDILGLYNAYRKPIAFQPEDIISAVANPDHYLYQYLASQDAEWNESKRKTEIWNIGSNNWVLSGQHTQSGYPIMANDPHRTQSAPSLRYMSHLVGPGWNVIGGGEPEIPGISIGHNDYGAWGLTVFRTDAEDLYFYKTNPQNPNQYWYDGQWEDMRIIRTSIPVKGKPTDTEVDLKYTRHGPVLYENEKKQAAVAMRCGWLEIGGSPYLASLRMDQATDWESFRQACNYSHIPGENMVWADQLGNIGWQAVGIAPIRRNWSGLVPVYGDGTYEWDGYLPIVAKPNALNPSVGYIATSNENVVRKDYLHRDAVGYSWSDPFRGDRVREVLLNGQKHSLMDMAGLQTDYHSIPARTLVPLLKGIETRDENLLKAIDYLVHWDYELQASSVAAGIYNKWEQRLKANMEAVLIPESAKPYLSLAMFKIIHWLTLPDGRLGKDPIQARDDLLLKSLAESIEALELQLGNDWTNWQYGQPAYKHAYIKHPLGNAVNAEWRKKLDVGPVKRGGNSYTVNNTSGRDNQRSGASFRMIVDTKNWDHCLGTNAPGQAGNPDDPHYKNLFDIWAKDRYFPVFYSREKVESVTAEYWTLKPF